jgi:hypothetical protein
MRSPLRRPRISRCWAVLSNSTVLARTTGGLTAVPPA